MKTFADDQMLNTQHYRNRLNFALVIEATDYLRNAVVAVLRAQGWLVHGVSRGEQALSVMAHIPYNLIVLGSELPGIGATDFVRILQNSREWQGIRLVVINSSQGASWEEKITDSGAFLARRSMWQDDLSGFSIPDKGACGA